MRSVGLVVLLISALVAAISVLANGCESISFDSQGGGRASLVQCYSDSSGALPGRPAAIAVLLALALVGLVMAVHLWRASSDEGEPHQLELRSGVLRILANRISSSAHAKEARELILRADRVFGENASHAFFANDFKKLAVYGSGSVSIFDEVSHRRLNSSERDGFGRSDGVISVVEIDGELLRGPAPMDLVTFFIKKLDIRESLQLAEATSSTGVAQHARQAAETASNEIPFEVVAENATNEVSLAETEASGSRHEAEFERRLNVLTQLLAKGVISKDEFASRRAEIISEI